MVVLPKPLSQLEGAVLPPDLDKNDPCICNLAMNCEGGGRDDTTLEAGTATGQRASMPAAPPEARRSKRKSGI